MRDDELPLVHDLVLDAFALYPIPMRPSLAQLGAMLERRGVEWSASFGAFHKGELVGVTLTAIDEWPVDHVGAYAVLAGVRRGWQGQGVLTGLFEWLSLALDRRAVTQMQLEVLIDNPRARRVYERLGFDVERHLFCFELPRLTRPQRFTEQLSFEAFTGEALAKVEAERGQIWAEFWTLMPAWTNSTWTVRRTENRVLWEARWSDEVCGYAVLEPDNAELLQIAIAPEHRRKGIATELVRAAQRQIRGPTIRILNVEDRGDRGVTIAWLRSLGATMTAVQLEMVLHRIS